MPAGTHREFQLLAARELDAASYIIVAFALHEHGGVFVCRRIPPSYSAARLVVLRIAGNDDARAPRLARKFRKASVAAGPCDRRQPLVSASDAPVRTALLMNFLRELMQESFGAERCGVSYRSLRLTRHKISCREIIFVDRSEVRADGASAISP